MLAMAASQRDWESDVDNDENDRDEATPLHPHVLFFVLHRPDPRQRVSLSFHLSFFVADGRFDLSVVTNRD